MLNIGSQISQYKIITRLGGGGMGEVFLAKDLRLGREVAIKVLYEPMAKDSALVARFEREARSLAALSHPNILTIYDFSTENGVAFAVMEYLEGETLRTWITRRPLDWQKALEIAIFIAEGLAAAHSKAVIHRDLKPENIFITSTGLVKILDFGLARIEANMAHPDMGSFATLGELETAPGVIMGTIPYMSPEQVCGGSTDARTDIFSFGCVLYEMLMGTGPFHRTTAIETSAAILKDKPSKLSRIVKKFPSDLEWIIMRCLEKEREERFPSVRDLVAALKTVAAHSSGPSSALPSSTTGAWKKPKKTSTRRPRKNTESIAILPFTNASNDSESEYLSDGLTENIINSLSQIPKLRVMARSTVFRYKNKDIDPQTIGQELNVQVILTGRVTHYGDLLKIQTELVDVLDGSQIWGEQYNRKFSDLITTQEEIAHQISEKLQMKLSGEDKKRLTKRHTENTKAYEFYLKGRYYWNKRTSSSLKKGIEFFQQAIDIDPTYASAYAGLADCYIIIGLYGASDSSEAYNKAEAAATKALQIEDLAEAHTALGSVRIYHYWDWLGAEKEFQRALELNPDYPTAHHWYGTHLIRMGRFDEGISQLKRAQQLDPLSLVINQSIGWACYLSRQYDQAVVQYLKVIDMDENFYFPHAELGVVYLLQKKYTEAIAEIKKSLSLSGSPNIVISALLGYVYGVSGEKTEAENILAQLTDISEHNNISPMLFAMLHTGLGNTEQALSYLEKACERRDEILIRMRVDPLFDPLRVYPRFAQLMKQVGLPE